MYSFDVYEVISVDIVVLLSYWYLDLVIGGLLLGVSICLATI